MHASAAQDRGQRGAVLPLTVLILLVLSAVLVGLSMVTGREPAIAGNHVMLAQAQALAEAGLSRGLWALSNPESADGVPTASSAPAPYDGSRLIAVAAGSNPIGGFRLTIGGVGSHEREMVVAGLVPGDEGALGAARQEISATAIRLRFPDPPAGLTVRGDLTIGSGVVVDASADGSCGDRAGTWSTGATTVSAGSRVHGRDATPAIPNQDTDIQQGQPVGGFDDRAFSARDLSALRAIARARGTYYRGPVNFDAAQPMPDGLIFVDTLSGNAITDATPDADLAAVTIRDGAIRTGGSFRGWIVVNGSLLIEGSALLEGLAYAADRISQTGASRLVGALMAGHVRTAMPSLIDARPEAGAAVVWNCEAGRSGGGSIPQQWILKPGSYREAAG
ncbi:MAG TPA: hypothetical protein VJX92_01785 [Methylomirabilota bacterium]|nr:hypothetical protein [Methylomirabilota bacterium]